MKFTVFVVLLFSFVASAHTIDTCGTYEADGYYTEINSPLFQQQKKRVILLDRGTDSQITFYITNPEIKKMLPDAQLGVNFKFKLKFTSACFYQCEGEIVDVIDQIDPFHPVRTFLYPRPKPLAKTEVACQANPFEK